MVEPGCSGKRRLIGKFLMSRAKTFSVNTYGSAKTLTLPEKRHAKGEERNVCFKILGGINAIRRVVHADIVILAGW